MARFDAPTGEFFCAAYRQRSVVGIAAVADTKDGDAVIVEADTVVATRRRNSGVSMPLSRAYISARAVPAHSISTLV